MDMGKFREVKRNGQFVQFENKDDKNIILKLLYQIYRLIRNVIISIFYLVFIFATFMINIALFLITCFIGLFIFGYVLAWLGIL